MYQLHTFVNVLEISCQVSAYTEIRKKDEIITDNFEQITLLYKHFLKLN